MFVKFLILTIFGFALVKSDGLTVGSGVKCGVKICKASEYCSEFAKSCEDCAGICDQTHHNFDEARCEKSCQIYLHDVRYILKDGNSGGDNSGLKGQVDRLSRMVTVLLTLTCLMLIVLFGFLCFQFYRWKEKKNITFSSIKQKIFSKKSSAEDEPRANNAPDASVRKGELKLDMPSNMSHSDHSPVTVTTSISRRPAEDSTLDYAYDNPALSPSR